MGFNNRTPSPLDPAVDPLLPQADSSQAHDIPTGVSPTTAKLQDWIAWLSANSVLYSSPGVVANDIQFDGDIEITGTLDVDGAITGASLVTSGAILAGTNLAATSAVSGATVSATGALSGQYVNATGTQPASTADPGANRMHGTNLVKAWIAVQFNAGVVTVLDGFNTSSVTISGINTQGVVVFARAMANANYAITYGCGGVSGARNYATTVSTGKATTGFMFNVWDEAAGAVVDLTNGGTNVIVSVCVMGRQ